MILHAIEIENYKQYSGSHRVDFPEQGLIAITGPNGAGKTTLFEAIEWCLYCPRQIPQASVPPHGGSGHTIVRLTLLDPADELLYVVERKLTGSGTQAEIYREENPGEPIVQGTRQVTDYVARTLIGLPHAAFVSTFFTRQKELSFFGDYGATDRRTEVARLLGFEAIRAAHAQIGEERTAARNAASSLRAQYERESSGRDFATEIALAEQEAGQAKALAAQAEQLTSDTDAAASAAFSELERCRDLQAHDGKLRTEIAAITGEAAVAARTQHAAEAELARLEARAQERQRLLELASGVELLAATLREHEQERQRADRLRVLQETSRSATTQLAGAVQRIRQTVTLCAEAAVGIADWCWRESDDAEPAAAAVRLAAVAAAVDNDGLGRRLEHLLNARTRAAHAEERGHNYRKLRNLLDVRMGQRQALLDMGDPRLLISDVKAAAEAAAAEVAAAQLELSTVRAARRDAEESLAHLREHAHDSVCPTCTRPLSADESSGLLQSLQLRIGELARAESANSHRVDVATAALEAARQDEQQQADRLRELQDLDCRLREGQDMTDEAKKQSMAALAALECELDAAGVEAPPTDEEIAATREAVQRARQIHSQVSVLEQLGRQAREAKQTAAEADLAIVALGVVGYDEAAHAATRDALDAARDAAAQVQLIERELADRPRYEEQRAAAEKEGIELAARRAAMEAERQALGYSDEVLVAARETHTAAQADAQQRRQELAIAQRAAREAEATSRRVVEERDRVQRLITEAERMGREADDLERMYSEFARFDQHVADHIGPLLAETTERLLSQVTEGKYDHVRFDSNYGIEVFDGDEPFALEGFSGGERDVVALCARLAMSELVGSAATRPPRFLVLDEVFGSLDSERRAQLLSTLGSLASGGHFQQMFIISHVDDVQQAPEMNEAWTIEERDGVSHVNQNLGALLAG